MGVEFVRVITKEEQAQGAKLLGWMLGGGAALITAALAVAYWKVTLVVLGLLVLAVVVGMMVPGRR